MSGVESRPLGEIAVLDDVGPARRGRAYPSSGASSALLLPAALLLGGLVLWPLLRTVEVSVTDPGGRRFVGLANFRTALSQVGVWAVIGRTMLWGLVVPGVVTMLGYLLATTSRRGREGRLARLVLVAPIAVPLVVTGVVFRLMYDPDPRRGMVTDLVATLTGQPADRVPALIGPGLITLALMSAFVWAWVGLAVVVFRAALEAVPTDLADAVRASGGNRLDVFLDARWRPLLRRTVAVVFVLVALGTVRTFDLILVMAPGSVRDQASVMAVRVWQTAGGGTSGPGAALGVLWLAAVGLGMLVAALGTRQAWQPPSRAPGGGSTAPPVTSQRVAVRMLRPMALVVSSAAAVLWAFPLAVLVATSLHSRADAATRGWWTLPLTLSSYTAVLRGGTLTRAVGFTFGLAVLVTAVVVTLALLAAYPLASVSGPVSQGAGMLLLATAVVPVQAIAGPVNEVLGAIRLTDTAYGLALVHVAFGLPFAVLVLRNALTDRPPADLWRVRLAGARPARALWRMIRSIVPAVIAVCVLEFVQVWNDLVVGLLFSGPDAAPLGLALYGQVRQFVTNSGQLAASSVIAALVPVLLVILFRRQVVAGLVSGAIR